MYWDRERWFMKRILRLDRRVLVLLLIFLVAGCVIIRSNSIKSDISSEKVSTPVKVHLKDGRIALFESGAEISENQISGDGTLYSLNLDSEGPVSDIDRDEVAAYEVFTSKVDPVSTFFVSTLATAGTAVVFKALFGSCPTIYSGVDSAMVLESELFSNSIAPMLESRDVTPLHGQPENGILELEVRNEALETHYINHMELLEVIHNSNTRVISANDKSVLEIGEFVDPVSVHDSHGKDLHKILADTDSLAYDFTFQDNATFTEVKWDSIDLVFPPTDSDSGALYINLRNSLFTTVLLYDYLFGSQGVNSLDWISNELATVSGAVALGDFNHTYMGLRIEKRMDNVYKQIGRIQNTGPIAWREIAVPVSMMPGDSLHLRLKFLSDSWRINEIKLAAHAEPVDVRYIPIHKMYDTNGNSTPEKVELLQGGDDRYVVTYPGDRFTISFETGTVPDGKKAGYLLSGQGYYIEWIRDHWLDNIKSGTPIEYSGDLIRLAQQKWQKDKEEFEKQFFQQKIPVQ